MSLVPVGTSSEVAVTSYLQRARDWLTQAVETTGPENIAAAKAEIATAAEATKQLGTKRVTDFAKRGELYSSDHGPGILAIAEAPEDEFGAKNQTNAPLNQCVVAAAVDVINRGKGGKKLPAWWKGDAA